MLLVNHGKRCPRCAKNGQPRKASDGDCPLFGSKSAKEVLKEELEVGQDSQVKQEAEHHQTSLSKQEGSEEAWVSAVRQDPDAGHSAVKDDADSDDCGMAPVKSETGTDSEYKQQKRKDGSDSTKAVPRARRSSRSTRYQAKTESVEDANTDNAVAVKTEVDS